MILTKEVSYKGKKFTLYGFCIKHKEIYPKGEWKYIARQSVRDNILTDEAIENDKIADDIDCEIYHYVDDEFIDREEWSNIAKNHLDEEFELIDEVE